VRNPERRKSLGRPRRKWEHNTKIEFLKVELGGGGGMEWIDLSQGRDRWPAVVNAAINLRVS
jgi:hypothetical protein